MKVIVDADACPVISIVEKEAQKRNIPVLLLCDPHHELVSSYSQIQVVEAGKDAVDFALVGICQPGDVVVSQDYGVAAMVLGKEAYGIHPSGKIYTNDNIDRLLLERHMASKARQSKTKKYHFKKMAKRIKEDDERFEESFRKLLNEVVP